MIYDYDFADFYALNNKNFLLKSVMFVIFNQ